MEEEQKISEREDRKKQSVLKMIEIRLKGISEATNRAKIAFIITIIASCAMLITVFNSYFSFTRFRAFEGSPKFKVVNLKDSKKFFECLESNNDDYCSRSERSSKFVKEVVKKLPVQELKDKLISIDEEINNYQFETANEGTVKKLEGLQHQRKILLKPLFETINNTVLEDMNLYRFNDLANTPPTDDRDFNELFRDRSNKGKADDPDKENYDKQLENIKSVINYKIFHPNTLQFYGAAVNNVNKVILERLFPQLEWDTFFTEKNIPYSMYEQNKRAISEEWIENQNIRISLLGVNVNVDQFTLLGSATLTIISFWMLFSQRRENRAVITLLRDVKEEVKRPKDGEKEKYAEGEQFDDWWDIANLAFHGIVHNMVFAQTGHDDRPMSTANVFRGKRTSLKLRWVYLLTAVYTWLMRVFVAFLFFIPFFTILTILIADWLTTTEILYPFFNNPAEALIQRNISFPSKISSELVAAFFLGVATLGSCIACLIFQTRTTRALIDFDEALRKRRKIRYYHELIILLRKAGLLVKKQTIKVKESETITY